jgi:predicted CopG family antitoxin
MVSKTISIKLEVYKALKKQKQEGETISDVIARLLGLQKEFTDYDQFFGRWKDLPKEYFEIMEKDRCELRAEINRKFE